MFKKAWCMCKVVVLPIQNLIAFLPFSLPSLSSLLKPLISIERSQHVWPVLLVLWIGAVTKIWWFDDVIQNTLKQYPHHNTKANQQWFPQHQETTGQSRKTITVVWCGICYLFIGIKVMRRSPFGSWYLVPGRENCVEKLDWRTTSLATRWGCGTSLVALW